MFTPQEILTRVHGTPFVPFEIITSAGESHPVRHPELINVGTRFVTIGIGTPQAPKIADMETRVAYMQITEIQDLPVTAGMPQNGSSS